MNKAEQKYLIDVGRRLKTLRGDKQAQDIAKIAGQSGSIYSRWERGVHGFSVSNMPGLCKALNATPNEICGIFKKQPDRDLDTARFKRLIEALSQIDDITPDAADELTRHVEQTLVILRQLETIPAKTVIYRDPATKAKIYDAPPSDAPSQIDRLAENAPPYTAPALPNVIAYLAEWTATQAAPGPAHSAAVHALNAITQLASALNLELNAASTAAPKPTNEPPPAGQDHAYAPLKKKL